jgi:putative GTP pyrophosphokinase
LQLGYVKSLDELAYIKYKQKDWASFFRNAMKIRFEDLVFSEEIDKFLSRNPVFVKELIRSDRDKLILSLANLTIRLPLKMDNVIFVINRAALKNQRLIDIEPGVLKQILIRPIWNRII